MVNHFLGSEVGFMSGGAAEPDVTISYEGAQNAQGGAASTDFTSQSIGTAGSNRHVICCVTQGGASKTTDSVTINGVSATKLVGPSGGGDTEQSATIWGAAVPTGTSVTINVTTSAAVVGKNLMTYAMYDGSLTVVDSNTHHSSNPQSLDLTIPAGGAAFGTVVIAVGGVQTCTWVGLTEDQDSGTGNERELFCASRTTATELSSETITATTSGGATATGQGASVSLGKA